MIASYIFEDENKNISEASERPNTFDDLRNKIRELFQIKGDLSNYNIYYMNEVGIRYLIINSFDFERIKDDEVLFIINKKKFNNNNDYQKNISNNNNYNYNYRYHNNINNNYNIFHQRYKRFFQNNYSRLQDNNNLHFQNNNEIIKNNSNVNFRNNYINIQNNNINNQIYNFQRNNNISNIMNNSNNRNYYCTNKVNRIINNNDYQVNNNNINPNLNNNRNFNNNFNNNQNDININDKNNNYQKNNYNNYEYNVYKNENNINNFNNNNNININQKELNNINAEEEEQSEKEIIDQEFLKKYNEIIKHLEDLYYKEINNKEIINIIKNLISRPGLTIFEVMNLIEREVQIIKNIHYIEFFINGERKFINSIEKSNNNKYKSIINKYKIFDNKNIKSLKSYWLYIDDSDKRRRIVKDENGYYNYIPSFNTNKNNYNDIFAKNENEIVYHYLYYKTLLCKNCDLTIENEEDELCPYSHNILKDFRIIYNYQDERIREFMALLVDSNLFQFEDYRKFIPINIEHNLNTLKIHKCLNEEITGKCPNNNSNSFCPFYHDKDDPPCRPVPLIKYVFFKCECYEKNNNKCKFGEFCLLTHNMNEYKFHPYNNTECNELKETKEDKNEEISEDKIEDKNIENIKEKINSLLEIGKIFLCRKCDRIDKIGELCYFTQCKHFLCKKCFMKMNEEEIKGENENPELFCPFCKEKIEKNKVVLVNFNQN